MYATPRACMYGSSESTASITDSLAISDQGCPCATSRSICATATPQNTPAVKASSGVSWEPRSARTRSPTFHSRVPSIGAIGDFSTRFPARPPDCSPAPGAASVDQAGGHAGGRAAAVLLEGDRAFDAAAMVPGPLFVERRQGRTIPLGQTATTLMPAGNDAPSLVM